MDVTVQDNPARHRFEILLDGEIGGFADYRQREGAVVVVHSEVDRAHRGKGLGGILAQRTLDSLRERGEKVVPACPFFAKYVADHPEYADIVVQ
jgi:predicted GNAT family acetyltransferase